MELELLFSYNFTKPAKPMKAIARIPAVTNAIGIPFTPFGTSTSSRCSLKPAKITIARVNPSDIPIE